jgi:hypothetical protein
VTFAALTCDFILKSQIVQSGSAGGPAVLADARTRAFHPLGMTGLPVMEKSSLAEVERKRATVHKQT